MKFEENWPRGFWGDVVYGRTDDERADDGRQVITKAFGSGELNTTTW